jgi:hypothetical protein
MKMILTTLCLLLITYTTLAASSIGNAPGLTDSGLKQFECTIQVQQIDPNSGKMGRKGSIYAIVLATETNSAKAAALNKLNFYGPVEGSLFYMTAERNQFEVQGISCH